MRASTYAAVKIKETCNSRREIRCESSEADTSQLLDTYINIMNF